jgi:hypothetical protein
MELRRLTEKGIERFRAYLRGLSESSGANPPPPQLLSESDFSKPAGGQVHLEQKRFSSRLDLARYLDQVLEAIPERPDTLASDIPLWSWMSLFYFDQVCPVNDKGKRKPGREYRHIPEPGYPSGHRHLLAGAYLVYTVYGWGEGLSRLALHTPLSVESHFHHQIATRQSLITNRGIMEALHILYYDETLGKPKRGPAMNKAAPGSLYRFIDVIQQLDVTHDLYSMTGGEIVSLLPEEFGHWLSGQRQLGLR